jgi:hypothetical protein
VFHKAVVSQWSDLSAPVPHMNLSSSALSLSRMFLANSIHLQSPLHKSKFGLQSLQNSFSCSFIVFGEEIGVLPLSSDDYVTRIVFYFHDLVQTLLHLVHSSFLLYLPSLHHSHPHMNHLHSPP